MRLDHDKNIERIIDNIKRSDIYGKPYLTDESDFLQEQWDADEKENARLRKEQSIQRWNK